MSDRLALLIPAYNAAGFLPRLLASAHAQTTPFDEIWVYDDCSTDDTAAVAERLGAKVVRGAVNLGCSAGKNVLAQATSAEWVHFHDADDELKPSFVELARKWIDDGRHDVVLFAYEERDDATGKFVAIRAFEPEEAARDARSYAIRTQINPFCGLYRRSTYLAAGGYDEDPRVLFNEDVAFHIRMAFAGLSFAVEPQVAIINHRRLDSMSAANGLKCAKAHYEVLRKAAAMPESQPYARELSSKLWKVAGVLAAYLDWPTADAAASLARRLGSPTKDDGSVLFRALSKASPGLALRAREGLVRLTRPQLRAGYPG